MANDNNFKGGSPWGAPPGGKNGSRRGGQRPPSIDEVVEKIQKLISKLIPGGKFSGSKPIIFGLILLVAVWAFSGLYRVLWQTIMILKAVVRGARLQKEEMDLGVADKDLPTLMKL